MLVCAFEYTSKFSLDKYPKKVYSIIMTITQTVEILDDHRLVIDLPREIPIGRTNVIIQFQSIENLNSDTEKHSKIQIPKGTNGKFLLTKDLIEEMRKNSPNTQALSGILSSLGDVNLDEVRMERLKKHL
jgi:hypothetical protein